MYNDQFNIVYYLLMEPTENQMYKSIGKNWIIVLFVEDE